MLNEINVTFTLPPGTKTPTLVELERIAEIVRESCHEDPVIEAIDQAERTLDKLLVRYEDSKQMAAALEHVRQTRHAELLFNPHRRRGPE